MILISDQISRSVVSDYHNHLIFFLFFFLISANISLLLHNLLSSSPTQPLHTSSLHNEVAIISYFYPGLSHPRQG